MRVTANISYEQRLVLFKSAFYYDSSSKSCLKRCKDWRCGENLSVVRAFSGSDAGTLKKEDGPNGGYWVVHCGGKRYRAHRVIWEMVVGEIPASYQIDHINGIRDDNSLENLRCVTESVNAKNKSMRDTNTSGITGVRAEEKYSKGKFYSYYTAAWLDIDGRYKKKHFSISKLGYTVALELAINCREDAINNLNMEGAGYTKDHGKRPVCHQY